MAKEIHEKTTKIERTVVDRDIRITVQASSPAEARRLLEEHKRRRDNEGWR